MTAQDQKLNPRIRRLETHIARVFGFCLGMLGFAAEGRMGLETAPNDEAPPRPIDGIRDNSFLIEEAYNQEAGVVQHIFTAYYTKWDEGSLNERAWDLSFTQEWPVFGQTHQISYTVPYSYLDNHGEHGSGISDALMNYRWQMLMDKGRSPAISPRFSLVLPTGDEDRGFGDGVTGYQFNLPISKTVSDRMYVNVNVGFTWLPGTRIELRNGKESGERDLLQFNAGASLIFAATKDFHLMLEIAGNFDEELSEGYRAGRRGSSINRSRPSDVVVSPGFRWAQNLPKDLQIVYGLAVPIGVTEDAPDYGVFLYLSIEHPFLAVSD